MRIPMRGSIGSLNAAVAGSILLFEAVAQRDPAGDAAPPRSASVPEAPEPLEGAAVAPETAVHEPEAVDPEPAGEPQAEPSSEAEPDGADATDLLPGGPEAPEPPKPRPTRRRTPRA